MRQRDPPSRDNVVPFPKPELYGDPRVLLTLHNGTIVAKYFTRLEDEDGVAVECRDGTTERYVHGCPLTIAEYYGIDLAQRLRYEEKRRIVMAAEKWECDEDCEWLKTDEQGNAIPETDTDATLTAWLQTDLEYDPQMRLDTWCRKWASELTPGYELLRMFPPEAKAQLRLKEAHPYSAWCCVVADATLAELNAALAAYDLPFLFVSDTPPVQRRAR